MTASPDQDLLAAARAGDRAALEALLQHHERRIYDFGLRMCRHPEDAEDVLQETLLTAARRLDGFRGESALSTWLYAIARSHCIKRRTRRRSVAASVVLDEATGRELADPAPDPAEQAAARELVDQVRAALASLTREQREVLVLRDGEGLTAPEVAAVLGIDVGAVKARLHRARAALRERLGAAFAAPAPAGGECVDVPALYSRHLEGDIDAGTCARMERHLAGCGACRASCEAVRHALRLCRAVGDDPVPPAVQQRLRAALKACLDAR